MCPFHRGACWLHTVPRWICPQEQSTKCPALITRGGSAPSARVQMSAILSHEQGMFIIQSSSTVPTVLCLLPCSGSIMHKALALCAAHRHHCPRQLLWSPSKMWCQMMNSSARGPRVKTAIMAVCASHAKSTHSIH